MLNYIMSPTKSTAIREHIMSHINTLDIAWYLKSEVENILWHLHYYKLKNIQDNLDALEDFLHYLDVQNTEQIKAIDLESLEYSHDEGTHVLYFISNKGLDSLDEVQSSVINGVSHRLQSVVSSLQGFLLLTIDEFCCATNTRMWLNRRVWQEALDKKELVESK